MTITVAKASDNNDSTIQAKLTKQQKRDRKRNATKNDNLIDYKPKPTSVSGTSVYKRPVVYPQPYRSLELGRFIEPYDSDYKKILKTAYDGFEICHPTIFNEDFHVSFLSSFEGLDKGGYFQYDITQPAGLGTKLAKTFVTRCLVGEAGITYKYLGLRMFSLPWNLGAVGATAETIEIGKLNLSLVKQTESLLKKSKRSITGSCAYNLTLVLDT